MSTSWHLFCVDCQQAHGRDADLEGSTAREDLCALVADKAKIAQAHQLLEGTGASVEASVAFRPSLEVGAFVAKHAAHRLAVQNEYGDLATECAKLVRCGACEASARCRLDVGHDGDCSPRRPS